MVVRIARCAAASSAFIAGLAVAQSSTALPPQNYGAQPGFFRNATEMAALSAPGQAALPTPAQPAPQPVTASPMAAPIVAPQASTVVVAPPDRVPDPTQNLQWAERQMDRAETTAVQQRQQAQSTPPPVAPGAYNGSTDPATR